MKFLPFLFGNLLRKKQRTLLAMLSIMVTFMLLCLLVATDNSFDVDTYTNIIGEDRLLAMNGSSRNEPLPLSYYGRIKALPGIVNVTHVTPFGGFFQQPENAIAAWAVDGKSYLEINPEVGISKDQKDSWLRNRIGVVVGVDVAEQHGWAIGDRIPLQSGVWRDTAGNNVWDVVIEAVYHDTRENTRAEALLMHYEYLNNGRSFQANTVSAYQLKITNAEQADDIAGEVDLLFENSSAPTKTVSELIFVRELMAQVANMGILVVAVASVVFFTLLLTIASTLGQSVRERAAETAALRIIGFTKPTLITLVLAESALLTLVGGFLGIVASLPIMDYVAGQRTPGFTLDSTDIAMVIALIISFGCLAGLLPALAAVRGRPVDTLRGE